jgi:hypothetical protein
MARSIAPRALSLLIALLLLSQAPAITKAQPKISNSLSPTWSIDLDAWLQRSSVALADIDGDNKQEIFVGTNGGTVYGLRNSGAALPGWPVNVIGSVTSAPAVGDITGDGVPEVVITSGGLSNAGKNTGGIWAFSRSGQLLWRKVTMTTSSTGLPGGVFASPVLVDLNGDGVLDVLTASYDQNIYAIKGNGASVFPGALPAKAGDRNDALIWLGDGSWATPAVGDVDGDGVVDIVVTSATNIDARFAGIYGDSWDDQAVANACSKVPQVLAEIDRSHKRACGLVAVFSNDGKLKPGWPKFIAGHTYDASPALVDFDGDGKQEIVTGNGYDPTYVDLSQPFYITIWNGDGSVRHRVSLSDPTFIAAPALGDIDGDGKIDIVVGTDPEVNRGDARKIFAFNDQLQLKPGFPVAVVDAQFEAPNAPGALSLADVSGDGKADIIFSAGWDVRAINGSGQYLNAALALHGTSNHTGAPALGDIDGDGKLELVYGSGLNNSSGRLYRYDLNVAASSKALPWAQFHGGVYHTGLLLTPDLRLTSTLEQIVTGGETREVRLAIGDTVGGGLSWTAKVISGSSWISLNNSSGTAPDALVVTLDAGAAGLNALGSASGTIQVKASGGISKDIAVKIVQVDQIVGRLYLPLTVR